MSILDWAEENGIEDQISTTQCEFLLLARFVDDGHAIIDQITLTNDIDKAMAHRWFPSKFPAQVCDADDLLGEVEYANGGQPQLIVPDNEPVVVLPHRVMWASDFSTTPLVNMEAQHMISDALDYEYDMRWIPEYMIGLRCLSSVPPVERLNEVNQWAQENEYSWEKYHTHLTIELLQALLA